MYFRYKPVYHSKDNVLYPKFPSRYRFNLINAGRVSAWGIVASMLILILLLGYSLIKK